MEKNPFERASAHTNADAARSHAYHTNVLICVMGYVIGTPVQPHARSVFRRRYELCWKRALFEWNRIRRSGASLRENPSMLCYTQCTPRIYTKALLIGSNITYIQYILIPIHLAWPTAIHRIQSLFTKRYIYIIYSHFLNTHILNVQSYMHKNPDL